MKKGASYGWAMVGVGSFCYGFGISPMYYSWGFFLPEMRQDIALTDTQAGLVFSVWSYVYHLLGPVVGIVMGRWGIRSSVAFGSVAGVAGFWLMSRAETFMDCLVGYGLLGGVAIGFSTILPGQTLASNWFVRYRARALSVVLAGGAIVGFFINKYFGPFILENWTWRTGWVVIACISAVVAVVGGVFIRGTPEDVGLLPDGETPGSDGGEKPASVDAATPGPAAPDPASEWRAGDAVRTYQFYLLVALSVAYGVPWSIVSLYGRTHLENLGFATALAGSILGVRVLVSLLGRVFAVGGDLVSPQKLLGAVLLCEGLGSIGLVFATTPAMAYLCVILIGLGFGAAYVSIPVVFSAFYGRRAFGATVGARFAITGLVAPAAPAIAGALSDWSGSYSLAFVAMGTMCLVGCVVAVWLPHPGPTLRPATSPA